MYSGIFVAKLRCPSCSPAELTTEYIQSALPILDEAKGWEYRVGSAIEIGEPERAGFIKLREQDANEPLHLLVAWDCGQCGRLAWAEIAIHEDEVKSIDSVRLDVPVLERAHYIINEIEGYFENLTGVALCEGVSQPSEVRERLIKAARAKQL